MKGREYCGWEVGEIFQNRVSFAGVQESILLQVRVSYAVFPALGGGRLVLQICKVLERIKISSC